MMFRRFTRSPWSTPSVRRMLCGVVSLLCWCGEGGAQLSGLRDGELMAPGAIEGVLVVPEGSDRAITQVTVTLLRTRAAAKVDSKGRFAIEDVPPGSYTLVAAGDGFSMLVITDVVVRPGQRVLLAAEEMPIAIRDGDVYRMEPVVVSARKQLEALERYEITEQRPEPFSTGNVDLPRAIDDPQPYYLFDRTAIERSGAATLEEFMQRRVPMDVTKFRLSDNVPATSSGLGYADNKSTVNLNGLGAEHTVILVNGRRLPKYTVGGLQSTATQPDINGIPLAAIERVEILPATNSAAYGSDAIGGVVNVVLRQDFDGAEIELGIENPYDGGAPLQRAAATVGRTFNRGRTNVMISLTYTKMEPLEYRQRRELLDSYRQRAWENDPVAAGAPAYANVPLGRTTNVIAAPVTRVVNGQVVSGPGELFGPGTSDRTFVPEGYAGGGGREVFEANAGKLDLQPVADESGQGFYFGLGSPLELETKVTAGYATVRHRWSSQAEVFGEFSHSRNEATNYSAPGAVTAELPANLPTNVFGVPVRVTARVDLDLEPSRQEFVDDRIVIGTRIDLPRDWVAQADGTWASTRLRRWGEMFHAASMQVDAQVGRVDVLRDLRANPIPMERYLFATGLDEGSWLATMDLRAAGPLGRLPAGEVRGAIGIGIEEDARRDSVTWQVPLTAEPRPAVQTRAEGGSQRNGNIYGELWLPVISSGNRRAGIAQLDVQLAGRGDWWEVRNVDAAGKDVTYDAGSFTAGVRYRPIMDVMLRASYASGFRAPDFAEIRPTPPPLPITPFTPDGWLPVSVQDPKRGGTTSRNTVSIGGNPTLRPERSDSVTVGVVIEPRTLPGLRLALDLTSIHRQDEIRSFYWQTIVDHEDQFPGRVTRGPVPAGDPYGVGPITFVDGTMMNVLDSRSTNYNFSVDYERATLRVGRWQFFALGNSWQHYQRRTGPGQPLIEQINSRGGITQGQPKFVGIAGVNWTGGRWSAGWSLRFYGHQRVHEGAVKTNGGELVGEQAYHDAFVGYAFPAFGAGGLARAWSGVTVQVGAKNVFNKAPPFDGAAARFFSPYGDLRRGSFYITLRKRF